MTDGASVPTTGARAPRAPHPLVERLGDSLIRKPDGRRWVEGYATWVVELSALDASEHEDLFVEIAGLAHDLTDQGEPDLARRVAALARIGLEPLLRRTRHGDDAGSGQV